ncbi:DNA-binding transcriptional ArsR family regulator [Pseudomonas duriflava]|uniref:DNA-binding transcriptional ArsR family regulator n=1 Tax=Pseudomonas duriflava TaxID=459528 RepID=A0A562PPL6_9PSED|nr:metalloregulator ArsR/SmtB family transcription factor [Pseudomonas duriflava]TWI46308.1 DNA-binding transcriptional ArsR family regulator [Pseudomonas duriflava]
MSESLAPPLLFKCLADETRLRMTLLIAREQELCVCELACALNESQPKVSRHLAQLRSCGLLEDRRQGQWVYYRIHPDLPTWITTTLLGVLNANTAWLTDDARRLEQMGDRPTRKTLCC